jgi:hypothetical protein
MESREKSKWWGVAIIRHQPLLRRIRPTPWTRRNGEHRGRLLVLARFGHDSQKEALHRRINMLQLAATTRVKLFKMCSGIVHIIAAQLQSRNDVRNNFVSDIWDLKLLCINIISLR